MTDESLFSYTVDYVVSVGVGTEHLQPVPDQPEPYAVTRENSTRTM